jgi:tetrahydromethanopterin S-methyltransferase subunit D
VCRRHFDVTSQQVLAELLCAVHCLLAIVCEAADWGCSVPPLLLLCLPAAPACSTAAGTAAGIGAGSTCTGILAAAALRAGSLLAHGCRQVLQGGHPACVGCQPCNVERREERGERQRR